MIRREGKPQIQTDPSADFHYEPAAPAAADIVTQIQEKGDPNFTLFEAHRKLNFAKSLLEQYAMDKAELAVDLSVLEDTSPDKAHIENKIKFLEEQTARLEKLVALEDQLNELGNEDQTTATATEIANTTFPFETSHYSDDALLKRLETMLDRLNYLIEAGIPDSKNTDKTDMYAWKSEIRDLKNYIPQIQAEVARRERSPLGRPILRVLKKPSDDAMAIDSGDYQLIDEGDSPTIKIHPLPPRAKKNDLTMQEKDWVGLADTQSNIPTGKMPPQS